MSKVTIQGVQLNNVYGNQVFIPYSVGMLGAYVQMNETINKKVDFKPFLYRRDKLSTLVNAVDKVNILIHALLAAFLCFNKPVVVSAHH